MIDTIKQLIKSLFPIAKIKEILACKATKDYIKDVIIDTLRYGLSQNKNLIKVLNDPSKFLSDCLAHLPQELKEEAVEHFAKHIQEFVDCECCKL